MEALAAVFLFLLVIGIIWAISHRYVYVWEPRWRRPQIIEALEESERLGLSDIESNPKRVAKRWGLMRMGHKDAARMQTEGIYDRLRVQLDALAPHEADLRRIRNRGSWIMDI